MSKTLKQLQAEFVKKLVELLDSNSPNVSVQGNEVVFIKDFNGHNIVIMRSILQNSSDFEITVNKGMALKGSMQVTQDEYPMAYAAIETTISEGLKEMEFHNWEEIVGLKTV